MTATGCGGNGGSRTQVIVSGSTALLPIAEVAGEMYQGREAVAGGTCKIQRVLHFFTRGRPSLPARGYIDCVLCSEV